MTDESHNVRQRPTRQSAGSEPLLDEQAATIRTTPVDVDLDSLPDQASLYVAPQPVPRISEHKTIDMVPVRLSPEVDPRHARTRRMEPVSKRSLKLVHVLAGVLTAALFLLLGIGVMRWFERESAAPAAVKAAPSLTAAAAGALQTRGVPTFTAPVSSAPGPATPKASAQDPPAAQRAGTKRAPKTGQSGRAPWIE